MWRHSRIAGMIIAIIAMMGIACKKPEGLHYVGIFNFRVNNLGLSQSVISADLSYYNPNNFKMQLKKAEMDVTVNNKFLGHSVLDTLMTIPKRDTFMLPVQVKVNMKSLLINSIDALFSNEFDVSLTGKARLGKGGIFFDFPFSYQGKQKIKLF